MKSSLTTTYFFLPTHESSEVIHTHVIMSRQISFRRDLKKTVDLLFGLHLATNSLDGDRVPRLQWLSNLSRIDLAFHSNNLIKKLFNGSFDLVNVVLYECNFICRGLNFNLDEL